MEDTKGDIEAIDNLSVGFDAFMEATIATAD